jgi:fumarate reductase subunit D
VVPELLVPVSLLLVPVSLLLLVLGFAKAGELKAPAVTRIIAVKTTMIVNVVVFIYITTTLSSYMYKELLNHVN